MKEAVAERFKELFKLHLSFDKNLSNVQRKILQTILDSKEWENGTEIDFIVQVKNSLQIQILLIEVEKNETKQIDTYQIFRLESNKWEKSNSDDIMNFETLILMYKFEQGYHILKMFTEEYFCDIRILELINNDHLFVIEIGFNLLMKYPKSPKLKFMCSFIDESRKNRYGKTLFEVLHENNRNGEIEFLLKNECKFPELEIAKGIPLIEQRLKSNEEFHKLIKDRNLEEIDTFLEKNPNQQYIFNEKNKSACWVAAMKMDNIKFFSFLWKKGLTFTVSELFDTEKDDICFQTITFTGLDLNNKFQILESKTLTTNKLATDLSVDDIYKELRKITSMNLILNILNKYRNILIHIDYQESISKFSPYRLHDYWFTCFKTKNIFISGGGGTKQLLGSFAIEFTHFVMDWLYKNFGNPYYSKDDKRQKRFNEIVQDMRKKISNGAINEEFIKSVFEHSERYWHSELITRVNYVFAYYGQDKGNQILQQQTPDLLQFYEYYVKPDLEKYFRGHFNHNYGLFNTEWLKVMEKHNTYVHELNNLWMFTNVAYSKNVVIQSDCVGLTCLKLFQNITKYNNSPLNLDNTYFIDFEIFSDNNYEIVSHLPQWELLVIFDEYEYLNAIIDWGNFSQYFNKVGKRFILIIDMKRNLSNKVLRQDNVVTFTDSFKPTKIDRSSEKLIFYTLEVDFGEVEHKLCELINFEEYLNISSKSMSLEVLNNFYTYSTEEMELPYFGSHLDIIFGYINRKFKTTICELDELRDEIIAKFVCENITDESAENHFEIKTKNDKLVTFPGKTLRIKEDYRPVNEAMEISSENSKKVYTDMENDIFIVSLKHSSESYIIIDEEIEIQINNFSYADLETFYENNRTFNIHWFVESENSQYFFHHLKTFGSFDKTRSFCYRQKCTIKEEELLIKLQNQKVFLIAAPAGMGKTETIKEMAGKLSKNDSSVWAPVVLLRNRTEILSTFCPENSDPEYVIDFLAKLLQYRDFEKEMFKVWCKRKANNVCLFLDGADENGPKYTDVIIELIKRLSQTDIKHIIVSMREVGKFKFEYELDTIAIEMEPLAYDDKIYRLRSTWKDKKEINNKIQIAKKVVKHFRDFDDFLNSPLQIELVAMICEDQLREFSKNIINIYLYFRDELSLIKMYKQFIENKFKKTFYWPSYDDSRISDLLKNSQRQLQYAAIRVLLNDDEVKLFLTTEEVELHKMYINDRTNWERFVGIVDGIYSEKLNFVHRTYAEYYFADFLLNHYKDWNENSEQFFFDHILVKKEFEYVRKFLNSYGIFIDSPGIKDLSSRELTNFPIPATLHDAVVQNIEENNINILQYLHTLRFNITINPSSLLTKYINDYSPNSIEKLVETIKYLVTNCDNVHLSIKELGQIKKVLARILLQDRIELIKALLQCELIDLDELREDHQPNSFQSLWNDAKAKVVEDPENIDSKQLLPLFDDIIQMINING